MAPLPALKLFALLVKTLAKPVANRIKVEVRRHPKFSEFCTKIGQATHQVTSRVNVYASGYKVLTIDPLPSDEALARGINFVSESFIFSVGAGILIFEYARSEAKSAAKQIEAEREEADFRMYLDNKFVNVYEELKALNEKVESLEKRVEDLESRSIVARVGGVFKSKNKPTSPSSSTNPTTTTTTNSSSSSASTTTSASVSTSPSSSTSHANVATTTNNPSPTSSSSSTLSANTPTPTVPTTKDVVNTSPTNLPMNATSSSPNPSLEQSSPVAAEEVASIDTINNSNSSNVSSNVSSSNSNGDKTTNTGTWVSYWWGWRWW